MSRYPVGLEAVSATVRKQRERTKRRNAGLRKVEVWITPARSDLLTSFARKTGLPLTGAASLVLECAGPLYVRELERRIEEVRRVAERLRDFERCGVGPNTPGRGVVRIGAGAEAVILDMGEYRSLQEKATVLLGELGRMGVGKVKIMELIGPARK